MGHSDQRFYAIFFTFIKYGIIKGQPLLVGNFVVSIGKDTGPGNRHTIHFEAHIPKQFDILFVMMVKIAGMAFGIIYLVFGMRHSFFDICSSNCIMGLIVCNICVKMCPCTVRYRPAFSAFVPPSFYLVGSSCATP